MHTVDLYNSATVSSPLRIPSAFFVALQQVASFIHFRVHAHRVQLVCWTPPLFPFYKLNVDGSSLGNPGHAGGGMILRDYHGHVIVAQAIFFGHSTSLVAEIRALQAGLRLCQTYFSGPVVIESDSKLLVDWLHLRATWPCIHYAHLKIIESLMPSGSSLLHVFREANAAADNLAKMASSSKRDFLFTSVSLPSCLKGIVALDRVSFPYLRK